MMLGVIPEVRVRGGPISAHYSTDPKCPKYGQPRPAAKMYAAREGSTSPVDRQAAHQSSKEGDEHRPSPYRDPDCLAASKERFAAAYSDSGSDSSSEYGSALSGMNPYGSQYSSEGELYIMEY